MPHKMTWEYLYNTCYIFSIEILPFLMINKFIIL